MKAGLISLLKTIKSVTQEKIHISKIKLETLVEEKGHFPSIEVFKT